jgi:hypothetical protein
MLVSQSRTDGVPRRQLGTVMQQNVIDGRGTYRDSTLFGWVGLGACCNACRDPYAMMQWQGRCNCLRQTLGRRANSATIGIHWHIWILMYAAILAASQRGTQPRRVV